MNDWREFERQHFLQTGHRRLDVTLVRGSGSSLWDEAGREYLDFTSGWGVVSLGHCHPAVVDALCRQAGALMSASDDVYTLPQLELAEVLLQHSPFERVWLQNSGTEGVEVAIKLARKYGKLHLDGAYEFLYAENAFHGRTLGSLAAVGTARYRDPFEPLMPGFIQVPFNDVDALKRATTNRTCAVLLETIQGEGGVNVPDDAYLREVRNWCDRQGLLLILDEVQVGMGRTGALFAFQHYGVEPDIAVLGKGLGSGVPISAVLLKEKAAVFDAGEHGTTFGGNPLVCAASLAVVRSMLDNDIPAHAGRMGSHLMRRLQELKTSQPAITDLRGRGLLIAVELRRYVSMDVTKACLANGLLLNPLRPNTLRLMPPLIVTEQEIDRAVEILEHALRQVLEVDKPASRAL